MSFTTFLSVALLALGSTRVVSGSAAACTNTFPRLSTDGGLFTTNKFSQNATDENPMSYPYYFNQAGFLAFDPTGAQHDSIKAFFQTCTPNYAQDANDENEQQQLYGRFFIPSINKCLAVTNPSDNPPYYINTADCPSAEDMSTESSIPFNFMAATEDDVDMRWVGNTIPAKSVWQSGCSSHFGQLFVNATRLGFGWNSDGFGQPNTVAGGEEDYRVHVYCPQGTGLNDFVVPT